MLDISFIRQNKDRVAESAKARGVDVDINRLLELDEKRRGQITEIEQLRAQRNELAESSQGQQPSSEQIEQGKQLKNQLAEKEKQLQVVEDEYRQLANQVPNIHSEDTPIGPDESGNQVLKTWGDKPEFDFEPKAHWDFAESSGLIDKERAAKVSGARFAYLLGGLVELELALTQLVVKTLGDESKLKEIIETNNLDVPTKAFIPVAPPEIIHTEVMKKMGRLNPPEDKYHLKDEDQVLIGSAEHSLGSMHMDEILPEDQLPLRYVGISSAFRREAGTYGKDTKGILRVHQFRKLEMESFTLPEHSLNEQNFFVAIQEHLTQALDLPYQLIAICTGDMGTPDFRQIDINTWMPGQNAYRETHTSDLVTDFQARRLNIRYQKSDGSKGIVHMNDATAFAGRTLIAIMENYQTKDGRVRVPEVLQPYMNKEVI